MNKIRFDIPRYDQAVGNFIANVLRGLMATHALLGKLPVRPTHHRGLIRNVRGEQPLDQSFSQISGVSTISIDCIKNTNIDEYVEFLYNLHTSMTDSMSKSFFKGLADITNATGNVLNAEGKPFSYDMFLDLLDMVEIDFDEKGNPNYPTLIISPQIEEKIKNTKPTLVQIKREQEIVARKKAEFDAKKRTRRLSK